MERFFLYTRVGYFITVLTLGGIIPSLIFNCIWESFSIYAGISGSMVAAIYGIIKRRKQITDWI